MTFAVLGQLLYYYHIKILHCVQNDKFIQYVILNAVENLNIKAKTLFRLLLPDENIQAN